MYSSPDTSITSSLSSFSAFHLTTPHLLTDMPIYAHSVSTLLLKYIGILGSLQTQSRHLCTASHALLPRRGYCAILYFTYIINFHLVFPQLQTRCCFSHPKMNFLSLLLQQNKKHFSWMAVYIVASPILSWIHFSQRAILSMWQFSGFSPFPRYYIRLQIHHELMTQLTLPPSLKYFLPGFQITKFLCSSTNLTSSHSL